MSLEREVTERLVLTAPTVDDLDDVYALHSGPRVWEHLPHGVHAWPAQTSRMLERWMDGWQRVGLDNWVARHRVTGAFVGVGGASARDSKAWNVYYRLAPDAWGNGYAQEIVQAARIAAGMRAPELPLVASLLERNEGSRRTAERAGLTIQWRGSDGGDNGTETIRLIYADRQISDDVIGLFIH